MKFLRRFLVRFLSFSTQGIQQPAPDEPLSRFIPSRSWFDGEVVSPDAFRPSKDDETSMFRLDGIGTYRTLTLGRLIVAGFTNGSLCGRAYIPSRVVTEVALKLKADRLTLHAAIRGWPAKTDKAKRKFL